MKTRIQKNQIKSISELWDNLKRPNNTDVIRVPERERQGQNKYLKKVWVNIFKFGEIYKPTHSRYSITSKKQEQNYISESIL